jgi:hypothetical protein
MRRHPTAPVNPAHGRRLAALWPGFALRLGRPSELTRIMLRQASAN